MFFDDQLKKTDIDTLKRWVRYKLRSYVVVFKTITTDNLFYRGVLWPKQPSKIDDVSYPPPDKARLGRANRAGQPMFYCSLAAPAVFLELQVKQGDLVAFSEWKVTEKLWMHNLGYHQVALEKMGTRDLTMRQRLTYPIRNETKENAKLRAKLSLAFTKDVRDGREYQYKLSIAINELLFDPKLPDGSKVGRVAGTVYPAIQLRGDADNVVIWPEFVDSSLRIKSVSYYLVEAADEAKSAYTFLIQAFADTFSRRDIIWKDDLRPERQRRSHFSLENDAWVLRNDFGRIIDRH
jgi:hypothetical protein